MKLITDENKKYILRFDRNEEVMEALALFCKKQGIDAGYFWAIGAASEVVLSIYNLASKDYRDKVIRGDIEVATVNGNISKLKDKIIVHAHGTFSDEKFQSFAGHVKKLVVSFTCEMVLEELKEPLRREPDRKTGLNLLD
ncbi:DNA-binding protein [Candidatus Gottesmanbacteria bacterium]|nr:DNA-binding protein [Candidatus Gottesmanbacteria bacterium]